MPAKGATATSTSSHKTVTRFAKFKASHADQQKPGPATKAKYDFSRDEVMQRMSLTEKKMMITGRRSVFKFNLGIGHHSLQFTLNR
jgi:hypothetical protein